MYNFSLAVPLQQSFSPPSLISAGTMIHVLQIRSCLSWLTRTRYSTIRYYARGVRAFLAEVRCQPAQRSSIKQFITMYTWSTYFHYVALCQTKWAHNIRESLQLCIEDLDEVERAFVHLDYETSHKSEYWTCTHKEPHINRNPGFAAFGAQTLVVGLYARE